MTKWIDLSHPFLEKMPVYPGDPEPSLVAISDLEKDGFTDYKITTGLHVGTHIDAPFHLLKNGKRLSEIDVSRFTGNAHLLDARGKASLDTDLLRGRNFSAGEILLFHTGLDKKFGQPDYYQTYPEITEALAREIVGIGIKLIGLDTPSPDRAPFPIHKILLAKEVLIVENLTGLEALLGLSPIELFAFPPKLHAEASPVRVVARVTT